MHKAGPATVGPAGSPSPVPPRPARRPTVWPRRTSRTSAPPSRGRLGALPRDLPPTPRDYCRQAPTAAGLGMLPPTPSADSATLPMNLPMASRRNVLTGGHATRIQRTSAQARTSENRMSVLLIRRFRVRSPDAPRVLTCGYASFKTPASRLVRPAWGRGEAEVDRRDVRAGRDPCGLQEDSSLPAGHHTFEFRLHHMA